MWARCLGTGHWAIGLGTEPINKKCNKSCKKEQLESFTKIYKKLQISLHCEMQHRDHGVWLVTTKFHMLDGKNLSSSPIEETDSMLNHIWIPKLSHDAALKPAAIDV